VENTRFTLKNSWRPAWKNLHT